MRRSARLSRLRALATKVQPSRHGRGGTAAGDPGEVARYPLGGRSPWLADPVETVSLSIWPASGNASSTVSIWLRTAASPVGDRSPGCHDGCGARLAEHDACLMRSSGSAGPGL